MLACMKSIIIVSLLHVLVQCEIPNLSVRKMDKSLIARKRQDTLDMCRIFTAENAKVQHVKPKIIQSYKVDNKSHNRRFKRDVNMKYAVNPALNDEDLKRVEKIVEKLYDDMEERGEKVTYRQNIVTSTATTNTTTKKPKNAPVKASRRFFFAPRLRPGAPTQVLSSHNTTNIYEKARWKHGIIPYFIDSKTGLYLRTTDYNGQKPYQAIHTILKYDKNHAQLQELIMKAFDYIEKATCVRLQKLRERPTDKRSLQEVDWVYITNPAGIRQCVHSNEERKIEGVQMSVLGYDCMSMGDIVHEVMHILGFSHEHTRSDRDQHISVLWDNIKPGYRKYFEITKTMNQYNLENLPYDHASVMHYPPRAFSKNGQVTILTESGVNIGQREGLSEIDLEKVGTMYSGECVERNREYLLQTCPSVVKPEARTENVTQKDIEDYFKDRIWPYGLISYQLRDELEFSTEERENIRAVIRHIEKETCIQFRDIANDTATESEFDNYEAPNGLYNGYDTDAYNEDFAVHKPPEIVVTDQKPGLNGKEKIAAGGLPKNVSENEIKNVDDNEVQQNENLIISIVQDPRRDIGTEAKTNQTKATTKRPKPRPKKFRRRFKSQLQDTRRHADSILVLTRSAMPGCKCPNPGKRDGNMVLEINTDCFNSVNDLLHLFVHVLGLDHQHNMHDRDAFLHIVWRNLTPDIKKDLKNKLPPAASLGFPYDYQSVTHYPWLQIKDGKTNMMYPIWNDGWAMGHWQGLSSFDIQKLNLLYFTQCLERQQHENPNRVK